MIEGNELSRVLQRLMVERIERDAALIGTDADVPDNPAAWDCELDRREADRRSGRDRRVTVREVEERRLRMRRDEHGG